MANHLTVTATHDGTVTNRDVRAALRGIDPADVSVTSPVSNPARLSTAREVVEPEHEGDEPTHLVHVRAGERDAEFTKKTTDAIVAGISTIDGVAEVDVDGGYEPSEPEPDADEDTGEDESESGGNGE